MINLYLSRWPVRFSVALLCCMPLIGIADEVELPDVDRELLEELEQSQEGEDIPLARERAPAGSDQLGPDVDPVTRIGEKMRTAEKMLVEKGEKAADDVKQLQQQIIKDIEELLKQIQKSKSKSGSSSDSQKPNQQSTRSKINQPQKKSPTSTQKESKRPGQQSQERHGRNDPQVDLAKLREEVIKEIWGHLPEKDRERLRQLSEETPLPENEAQIRRYFRHLAEQELE